MSVLKVAVPPGIGDALWSMVKVQSIMNQGNYSSCEVYLQETELPRGAEFINHFDFVSKAGYGKFSLQYKNDIVNLNANTVLKGFMPQNTMLDIPITFVSKSGQYNYIDSHANYLGYDWLLIANGHLERGNRIETWLPQLETNLDIGRDNFVFTEQEIDEATRIHEQFVGNTPFVVFYLGPKAGNTTSGYNRNSLWSMEDWHNTMLLMKEHNPNIKFVITGARYDVDYVLDFLCEYLDAAFINLAGLTEIGVTFALIKKSNLFVSYPCGLSIFSTYLGVPTVMFWRPYGDSLFADVFVSVREEMSTAWVSEYSLGHSGNYLPVFYTRCSSSTIVDSCINRGWI